MTISAQVAEKDFRAHLECLRSIGASTVFGKSLAYEILSTENELSNFESLMAEDSNSSRVDTDCIHAYESNSLARRMRWHSLSGQRFEMKDIQGMLYTSSSRSVT